MNKRTIIFNKYGGRCAYCGCKLQDKWHIDHLEPIRRNPDGTVMHPERKHIDNCMPSCPSCNINKHSLTVEQFRQLIKGFLKHLNEANTQYKVAKRYGLVREPIIQKVQFYFEKYVKEITV